LFDTKLQFPRDAVAARSPTCRSRPASPHSFLRGVVLLVAAMILATDALHAWSQEVFELEPEYVYGRNRKPRIGYRTPEVFDPLSDRLYQSGYKNFPPTAIPDELKEVPAMERVQKMGRILACADAWFWPFSRTARNNEPPGLEIELLQTIAKKHGWEVSIAWVNTGMRFGVGVTFSSSIDKGICDIFLGLTYTGDDHHMPKHKVAFTKPFMSTGYVLVTQGAASDVKTLDDAKRLGVRVGVPAYSPMSEYAEKNDIPVETFFQNYQVIDALVRAQINAAMIWSGAISQAKLEHPEAEFEMVKGYEPPLEMRFNNNWGIKEKETELLQFINDEFDAMLKSGETKRLSERYGIPFYPPVPQ
jgi:ABC-type amino acid transport substrate-binding protein